VSYLPSFIGWPECCYNEHLAPFIAVTINNECILSTETKNCPFHNIVNGKFTEVPSMTKVIWAQRWRNFCLSEHGKQNAERKQTDKQTKTTLLFAFALSAEYRGQNTDVKLMALRFKNKRPMARWSTLTTFSFNTKSPLQSANCCFLLLRASSSFLLRHKFWT